MKLLRFGKQHGYALLMVLAIVGVAALVAGSTIKRTYSVSMLNQRAKQFQGSMYAAEAAVEKVYARMRYDYVTGGDAAISNNIAFYRTLVPTSSESSHWANYQFWNAQGANNNTYVQLTSNKLYQVLDGSYAGLNGWRGIYRVISNARPLTGLDQVGAGVQQEVALDTIPAFQFAIFYNGQLEFTWCAALVVRGRTHANGPICLGPPSSSSLKFLGTVTTTSSILKSNLGGYLVANMTGPVTYSGTPPSTTGVPTLQLPIGTNNTAAAVREIINLPPSGESASSMMGQQRYHNKAAVVILVSNLTVTVTVKDQGALSGTTSNYLFDSTLNLIPDHSNLVSRLPFLSLTNTFTDYRQNSARVRATQINMGILKEWLVTNAMVLSRYPVGSASSYPNIMYVGDFRTASTNFYAVRVMNGSIIPTNGPAGGQPTGFTLATPNPIYVWGHYNTLDVNLGTTNTSATFPASLVGDALTILSPSWLDATYGTTTALASRNAANTTVNAAIIAGSVYSTGTSAGTWSGGVHNLPRLLENWSGDTLTLNTSLVNLYNSAKATAQFVNPGTYYNAPTRNFNFDQNFLVAAKLPPGTPTVSVISRYRWTTAPLNNVTYNAP